MLVEISAGSGIALDVAYAAGNNFTGAPVYARAACFLVPEAAQALERAAALAVSQGLRLCVFDAFRPAEAQGILWNFFPNPEFVADPAVGSTHSRGVAVDLTLVDVATGFPLDMGTPFDDFTPDSHHGVTTLPVAVQRNRLLLLGLMRLAGFEHLDSEWWHYNLPSPERWPLLDDMAFETRMMPNNAYSCP